MTVKTEIIKTCTGEYECEVINFSEMFPFEKDRLGERPVEEDYDRVIDNHTVVYLNGKRVIVFLKQALTEVLKIEPDSEKYNYWKWVSKDLFSDQRGLVGGKEMTTDVSARLTNGQVAFFREAAKGEVSNIEEAEDLLSRYTGSSRTSVYIKKILNSGFVDKERILELEALLRKKKTSETEREQALTERDNLRQQWFSNWLEVWGESEDKVAFASSSYKEFVSIQTRSNKVYSNILGYMDRSSRNPFGRLTATTNKRYEDFVDQKALYQQASDLYKDTMPEEWEYIHNIMKGCKDDRYTLLGTKTFSTITVNHNFSTFWHLDGKNNPRGVAVLTNITNEGYDGEKYDGQYFVMGEFRLAFNLRKGDFFVGDNCNRVHGQTEFQDKTGDAESVVLVFYARDGMPKLDSFQEECCRKEFILFSQANYADRYQKNSAGRFSGVYPEMWWSSEWEEYKSRNCPNATNTSYWYTGKKEKESVI
jgi:hypothetical protein